jgi:hypothetical protein
MERQGKGSRGLEAYCKGGQGPPRAVAPSKKKKKNGLLYAAAVYVGKGDPVPSEYEAGWVLEPVRNTIQGHVSGALVTIPIHCTGYYCASRSETIPEG